MKKTLFSFLIISSLFSVQPALAASKLTVAAWIPYWKKTAGVAETQANLNKLSEISPFSFTVDQNGKIIDTAKLATDPWPNLFAAARRQNVKILPSILWTDSTAIDKILSDRGNRQSHVAQITSLVSGGGWSGVDIDYENKFASTSPYYSAFLKDLGSSLHRSGKILSCTIEARTPPTSRYLVQPKVLEYANDYKALNKYCDEIRLMVYDQGTADIKLNNLKRRGGLYYPIADPAWVRKVLNLAVQDINPKKIMLGLATYGYELTVTDKKAFYDYSQVRSLSYKDLITLSTATNRPLTRNNAGELALTYATSGQMRFATFSDSKAITDKIKIAKAYNLRGVAIFKVDGESDQRYWASL